MSSLLHGTLGIFDRKTTYKILLLGLNSAGKTTLLYKLLLDKVLPTVPTVGFNVETIKIQDLSLTLWDIGGGDRIPPLWHTYAVGCRGVIFVLDATDSSSVSLASKHLHNLLLMPDMKECKVLVFANKQDGLNAMSAMEVVDGLALRELPQRSWHIQLCCALTGDGLTAGMAWFGNSLTREEYFKA